MTDKGNRGAVFAVLGIAACFAFVTHAQQDAAPIKATFHNCISEGSTANTEGFQSASEFYRCDEGRVEMKGRWSETIEYGYVYHTQLGRIEGAPHRVTGWELSNFKWCKTPKEWDSHQMEMCGSVPVKKCWDGKPPHTDKFGDWICVDEVKP